MIRADEIKIGDLIRMPGHWLHDDLGGLMVTVIAESVTKLTEPHKIDVGHTKGTAKTWFDPNERVELVHRIEIMEERKCQQKE